HPGVGGGVERRRVDDARVRHVEVARGEHEHRRAECGAAAHGTNECEHGSPPQNWRFSRTTHRRDGGVVKTSALKIWLSPEASAPVPSTSGSCPSYSAFQSARLRPPTVSAALRARASCASEAGSVSVTPSSRKRMWSPFWM